MCPKCRSRKVFVNPWSRNGYSKCTECGHDWYSRPLKLSPGLDWSIRVDQEN